MKQILPHFWVENGGKQISYTVGSTNLFYAPESQESSSLDVRGLKFQYFWGQAGASPPKLPKFFEKIE